jgi:probable phosphoglycerate mutase
MMKSHEKTTRFGLIRHAETVWNREKRIQGQLDSRLTAAGRRQAEAWGYLLKACRWDMCICSDLDRARATATIVNRIFNLPITCEAGLREQNWGRWSGRSIAQLKKEVPDLLIRLTMQGWQFRPPGGEDRESVWERGQRVLKAAAEKWPGTTILVVTHEGLIKCLVYRLMQRRFLPTEPRILKPAHLHWLVCSRGQIEIEKINAVALDGSGSGD